MRTKKNNEPLPKKSPLPEPAPAPAPVPAAQPEEPKGERFSFSLTPDGKIDFSSMRDKTREKMKEIFSDPKLATHLGIASPAAELAMISPMMVDSLWNMIGMIEASVLPMFFPKVPEQIFKQVFTYTPEEKAILVPPTTKVLNKYLPAWFIKYQDEIMLANLVITMTVTKCNAAIMLSKLQHRPEVVEMPNKTEVPPASSAVQ